MIDRLQQAAEWKGIPLEEAASKAVTEYLGRFGFEKEKAEQAIFEKMRPALLAKYRGQSVAVHNAKSSRVRPICGFFITRCLCGLASR